MCIYIFIKENPESIIFNIAGFNSMDAARVFHKLMERLEFSEYYVHGGDWGALITSNMAQMKPE